MYIYIEARPFQVEKFGEINAQITDFRVFSTAEEAHDFAQQASESMPIYHTFEVWKETEDDLKCLWGYSRYKKYSDFLQKEVENENYHRS